MEHTHRGRGFSLLLRQLEQLRLLLRRGIALHIAERVAQRVAERVAHRISERVAERVAERFTD